MFSYITGWIECILQSGQRNRSMTHLRARHISGHLLERETTTKVGPFGGAACFGSGKGRDEEGNGELHCDEMTRRVDIRGFFQQMMNEQVEDKAHCGSFERRPLYLLHTCIVVIAAG